MGKVSMTHWDWETFAFRGQCRTLKVAMDMGERERGTEAGTLGRLEKRHFRKTTVLLKKKKITCLIQWGNNGPCFIQADLVV